MKRLASRRQRLAVVVAVGALVSPVASQAQSAPDSGRPFVPTPVSQPIYGVKPPTDDPLRQRHIVEAADGVDLWTETWLPAPKDGNVPPERVPTVLLLGPYGVRGSPQSALDMETLVPRGYAWTTAHVRGTGESGGCRDYLGPNLVDDASRIIEYLGRDAPWTTGAVGMLGISQDGATQVVAAASGDPVRTQYLKAIVPLAPIPSQYDLVAQDGVPFFLLSGPQVPLTDFVSALSRQLNPAAGIDPAYFLERPGCQAGQATAYNNPGGDFTAFFQERDHRRNAGNIRSAVLAFHGHSDGVPGLMWRGLFDHLPGATPRAGVFGVWRHDYPDERSDQPLLRPEWVRGDFFDMYVAWFDRWMKGLSTGVEDWPVAQVQGTDGQWRTEDNWPVTGGPSARIALGPDGKLGVSLPSGKSIYREGEPVTSQTGHRPGTFSRFDTGPLPQRLELSGMPELDLWVTLDRPDAHIAVQLDALDADGQAIPGGRTVGVRSMQHRDPFVDGRFVQAQGTPAPVGKPIHTTVRLRPTDLVVPKGGRLQLLVAGSVLAWVGLGALPVDLQAVSEGPSEPSGAGTEVTVLHDCAHPSSLRFALPDRGTELLNVREKDEPAGPLADNSAAPLPESDAGGLATARVCGRTPEESLAGGPRCLSRRSPIGPRNVGRVRLGLTRRRLIRRIVAPPVRHTRRTFVWCVAGGGRVTAIFGRRGRVAVVATTAPRHGNRRVRRGAGLGRLQSAYPRARRIAARLYRVTRRSQRLVLVSRGRVRAWVVADRRLIRNGSKLRRLLRVELRR